jgi:hypothetical protein
MDADPFEIECPGCGTAFPAERGRNLCDFCGRVTDLSDDEVSQIQSVVRPVELPDRPPAQPPRSLNGWQRMWVVAAAAWTCLFLLVIAIEGGPSDDAQVLLFVVSLWLGPLILLYGFGWSVGWVIRGFRDGQ